MERRLTWSPCPWSGAEMDLTGLSLRLGLCLHQATACALDCLQRPVPQSESQGPPRPGSWRATPSTEAAREQRFPHFQPISETCSVRARGCLQCPRRATFGLRRLLSSVSMIRFNSGSSCGFWILTSFSSMSQVPKLFIPNKI